MVGAGPNGLVAALDAGPRRPGRRRLSRRRTKPGGGCRTAELTLPGFHHDVCSAVHPLLMASPAFARHRSRCPRGAAADPIRRLRPSRSTADAPSRVGARVDDVAASLGADGPAYARIFSPLVREHGQDPPGLPGLHAFGPRTPARGRRLRPARTAVGAAPGRRLPHRGGTGARGRHRRPLHAAPHGAALGRVPPAVHRAGASLRLARGGRRQRRHRGRAGRRAHGRSAGGSRRATWSSGWTNSPRRGRVVLDVTPRQLLEHGRRRRAVGGTPSALARYRYGPGVCKVDWALSGPVPWRPEAAAEAVTVHVGGTFEEIARSEADVNAGRHPDRPYCLVTQPVRGRPDRAPAGRHTLWAYCHVPNGSDVDMTERIEAQIERFAPGFRDLVLARSTFTAVDDGGAQPELRRAATSTPARPRCARWSSGRPCGGTRTAPPLRGRLPLLGRHASRAAASTACAGSGRHAPPCTTSAWRSRPAPSLMGRTMSYAWYRLRATMAVGALLLPLRHPPRRARWGAWRWEPSRRRAAPSRPSPTTWRPRTCRSSSSSTASSTRASGSTRPTTPSCSGPMSHLPHVERVESTVELNMGPLTARGQPLATSPNAEASVGGLDFNEDPITVTEGRMADPHKRRRVRRRRGQRQGTGLPPGREVPMGWLTNTQTHVWEQLDRTRSSPSISGRW